MLTIAILEAQNKRLREECELLREENRQLRANAREAEPELPPGISHLTRLEERALRALLVRPNLASKDFIYSCLYHRDVEVEIKIVEVMVCHLRRKIPASILKIETVWGRGYRLKMAQPEIEVAA